MRLCKKLLTLGLAMFMTAITYVNSYPATKIVDILLQINIIKVPLLME